MLVSLIVYLSHPSATAERLHRTSTHFATQGSIQGMTRSDFSRYRNIKVLLSLSEVSRLIH